jgi:F-type H+-transporting ATPase subunit a
MDNPLSSFGIVKIVEINSDLLHFNISLTNNSFYLLVSLFLLSILLIQQNGILGNRLIPSNLGLVGESVHASLLSMSRQTAGNQTILPFLLALFGIILMANLVSNIPYNYASTSALTLTLGLSLTVFIGVTSLAVSIKKWVYLATFVPAGTPAALLPVLVLLELGSYCARAISLGIRLFANLVAGHTLLTIISTMSNKILTSSLIGILLVIIPTGLLVALVGLEVAVAFIQAYVFVVLTAIYLDEAIKPLV